MCDRLYSFTTRRVDRDTGVDILPRTSSLVGVEYGKEVRTGFQKINFNLKISLKNFKSPSDTWYLCYLFHFKSLVFFLKINTIIKVDKK